MFKLVVGMGSVAPRLNLKSKVRAIVAFHTSSNPWKDSAETPAPARRRRRHRFGSVDEIPTFREFQQRTTIRNLYRKFWRLTSPLPPSQREDLGAQIRREFKSAPSDLQQAISEGNRRYKDLSAMFSIKQAADDSAATATQWPWQQPGASRRDASPPHIPGKSLE